MPSNPLTALDREEIRAGIERGDNDVAIAAALGRHPATIGREIRRNGGRAAYTATAAEARAVACRARPKTPLLADTDLSWHVTKRLLAGDSPMTISIELARGTRDGYTATISHETIYQGIYAPRRVGLPTKVYKLLHRRRPRRRLRGRRHSQQRSSPLGTFNIIGSRPAIAAERIELGHLEGDQIIGARNRSAIITIFDRTSRHLWLARHDHPTGGYNADTTATAVTALITQIPPGLRRTLTWDRGTEMANHPDITNATRIDIYFCDPHKPWQRPTNENGNGLIRRWLPKGTDLSTYTQDDLDRISYRINTIPRRSLGEVVP
jgi:IS30 family transposase